MRLWMFQHDASCSSRYINWLIDWSLTALSAQLGYIVPLEVIVCVLENRNTLETTRSLGILTINKIISRSSNIRRPTPHYVWHSIYMLRVSVATPTASNSVLLLVQQRTVCRSPNYSYCVAVIELQYQCVCVCVCVCVHPGLPIFHSTIRNVVIFPFPFCLSFSSIFAFPALFAFPCLPNLPFISAATLSSRS